MSTRMKTTNKTLITEIKQKADNCLKNRKNANNVVEILAYAQDGDEAVILACVKSFHKIFAHYLEVGEMHLDNEVKGDEPDLTKEEKFKLWLRQRYAGVIEQLLDLVQHANKTIQELSLCTLMKFVSKEGRNPLRKMSGKHETFPVYLLKKVVLLLIRGAINESLMTRFEEYMEFVDVRYYTMQVILHLCQDTPKQGQLSDHHLTNIFTILSSISLPDEKETMAKALSNRPGDSHVICSLDEHKKLFTSAWVEFLRFTLTASLYKKVLVIIHDKVMPYMTSPLLLSDFLTDSYNIGGSVSLLALNGVFVLVQQYNLNYPEFYKKLYALFEPSVFHVKYRSRFFYLCNIFLSSTHLPAYLVAAFAKKLARISLTAPPAGLLLAVPFIYNLISRHPVCKQLIHRPHVTDDAAGLIGPAALQDDPYDPQEPDPAKCRAIDSSLWELKTLQNHYHPDVVRVSQKIDSALPDMETGLTDLLDQTADDMFEKQVKMKVNKVAVTFEVPKGLLGTADDRLGLCWTL